MTVKIAVVGCGGRMGVEICNAILETEGAELSGGTEVSGSPAIGRPIMEHLNRGKGGPAITDDLSKIINDVDMVIDFTAPSATMAHFAIASSAGKGMIIGTTGLSAEQKETLAKGCASARCVMAPNMSVGVNVMFKLVSEAARIIGNDYDIEIVEMHHNLKKDAPSGTGARLAEICAEETNRDLEKEAVYGRHGITGERTRKEIGVMTLRGGDVVGDHTVIFAGPGERVEITHKAGSRRNFAIGSVKAALWLKDKGPGLYDMQDVLGLR